MRLEDIGVYPALLSEAVEVKQVEIPGSCILLIPVKTSEDGDVFKQRVFNFFGDV